jgi:hypothetical protein
MTQKEKADAYDNVRNKIAARFGTNVAQEIFSEYEESEDEKIRKELISFLQLPHPQFVGERKQEKWITWLEKQEGCGQKKYYDICDSSMMDNKKSPYGEKRDFGYFEEKPADKVGPKFKNGDYIERKDGLGCHAKIIFVGENVYGCEKLIYSEDSSPFFELMFENQDEFRLSPDFQQKPTEWHREDEQNLNACLGYIPDEFLRKWLTDIIHIKYEGG